MTVLNELGAYLQAVGIGIQGTSIFKGAIPADVPSVGVHDSLLALIEVPGLPPHRVHSSRSESIDQPMVQVVCRGLPHDYVDARDRAEAAWLALDGLTNVVLSGTAYLWIYAQQSPFRLPPDEMGRPRVVFNVRCGKARSQNSPMVVPTAFTQAFTQQSTVLIPGQVHRLGTPSLVYAVYDAATPAVAFHPGEVEIHPDTHDVLVTFPAVQSGQVILSSAATPSVSIAFSNETALTILGTTHGLHTKDILVALYDNASPANALQPQSVSIHQITFDVTVTFAAVQSGTIVLYGAA